MTKRKPKSFSELGVSLPGLAGRLFDIDIRLGMTPEEARQDVLNTIRRAFEKVR